MVSIIDWSSNGAQRENDHDIMYLTTPGEEITFSVTTDEPCDYSWEINKVEQGINSSGIIFTVPSLNCSEDPSKCIWEIHVKAYNADGEDHMEWVVSTLSIDEAPDIFDYFTDKKYDERTETDPWGRVLPEWTPSDSPDTSLGFLRNTPGTARATLKTTSGFAYGTWKVKFLFHRPADTGCAWFDLHFLDNDNNKLYWQLVNDGHHHCYFRLNNNQIIFDPTVDMSLRVTRDVWHDLTIVRTPDGWIYAYVDGVLDWKWQEKSVTTSDYISIMGGDLGGGNIMKADCVQAYNGRYLFPIEGIYYGEYAYSCDASPPKELRKNGIIIKGRNVTLADIANAINNPSLYTYDSDTKTAISYTNLFLYYGSELVIKDETLKFHCNSDGELEFAVGWGATLKIENSTIDSNTGHYYVWNFAGATTHWGYPLYTPPAGPHILSWASYVSVIIDNSIINNSAYFFLDSPLEVKITNTQFTNFNEVDIGTYLHHGDLYTKLCMEAARGNKSVWFYIDDINILDFEFRNNKISGKTSPLNIHFQTNAHRDRLNIYDVDLGNGNIVVKETLAQTAGQGGVQSHSCYVGGSAGPFGGIYEWISYIASEIGLVNCRFNDIIITPGIFTDAEGRPKQKSAFVKYYLDVKVVDNNGPVQNANVSVSVEQDWTFDDMKANHYPVQNMVVAKPLATGDYRCDYQHIRFLDGQSLNSTLTTSTGHTSLPSEDPANTLIITDYKKYLNLTTNQTEQINFTYTIIASKNGRTASMSGLDIDESWYRENPDIPTKTVVCNIDTGNCWVEGVATGTIAGTVTDTSGNPIEGATVSDGTRSATTASDGTYTISNVPVGTYTVTASKTGYETSSTSGVVVYENETTTVDFILCPIPKSLFTHNANPCI